MAPKYVKYVQIKVVILRFKTMPYHISTKEHVALIGSVWHVFETGPVWYLLWKLPKENMFPLSLPYLFRRWSATDRMVFGSFPWKYR